MFYNHSSSTSPTIGAFAGQLCSRPPTLQPGEPDAQLKSGVRAFTRRSTIWEQLGLHGDDVVGLEPEGVAGIDVARAGRWKKQRCEEKQTLLRMDFATFRNAMINIPAQIIRSGRRIIYRVLSWNRWQPVFFRLLDQLALPLRVLSSIISSRSLDAPVSPRHRTKKRSYPDEAPKTYTTLRQSVAVPLANAPPATAKLRRRVRLIWA